MNWKQAALVTSLATTGALVTTGLLASNYILNFKLRDVEVIRRREIKAKRLDEKAYYALKPKQVTISSKNGYNIEAEVIKKYPHKKWMIFCHGVTENRITSIKYMNLFLELGFNAIIFDHRRHGSSGGVYSTYGYYEKFDLEAVILHLKEHYGYDVEFGIHGESMGAATMLLYAGELASEAEFYISDCSFSSFERVLTHIIGARLKIGSGFLLYIINIFLRMRSKFSLYAVSPIKIVENIEQPVLFIHSKPDTFIPYTHSVDLYNKKRGPKMKWYPEYGGHAASYNVNPVTYRKKVTEFLESYHLLPEQQK
ncbi:alpha/beta hydrolase [Macrococcus equipercicus]|uniref:Alpha/beta hydrolase n=1 Tax=Macrococcus equipercicus TaxID=69967 RepID=A0A9Q9F0I8_9STAP|nr:alpha/beta hydrolase [Macrococcus equipercicus]KAA1040155.1 alpha/beta hydrolase [Macrococcus equipercicus]UTH12897.1 alpha/beta hydrolase [Macrococcus equipercicus]